MATIRVAIAKIRCMGSTENTDTQGQKASDAFWANMGKVEELLNDELPEGYYVKVEE